jgi:hypothetical protein
MGTSHVLVKRGLSLGREIPAKCQVLFEKVIINITHGLSVKVMLCTKALHHQFSNIKYNS